MRRKSLLCMVSMLALCTGLIMAAAHDPVPVMIYDHTGTLITDARVQVTDGSGHTVAKLLPAADGVYHVDAALMGQKVVFKVMDPALGTLNTMDGRIPEWVQGPVVITLPAPPEANPLGAPSNDTCDAATPLGTLPVIVSGDTTLATIDSDVVDCEVANTAPGVWYSVTGTGNPITATTCELDAGQPGAALYDTKISVYCLGCGADAKCVAGNDDTAGGDFCGFTFHSTVTFQSEAGIDYGILVHGYSTAVGTFDLSVYEGGTPTSPPVSCLPPVPEGACCVTECNDPVFGSCQILSADDCTAAGGEYQGDDVGCSVPNGTTVSLNNATQIAIPDGASQFVCTSIDVADPANCDVIADLDVGVMITHTWIGDLYIDINGPNGATSNLWQNRCGSTINMDFFFDDEGTDLSCAAVAAPGFGRGMPSVAGLGPALAQFDGVDPTGTWELCVEDTFPADSGTLDNWVLEIDCGSASCVFAGPTCGDGVVDDGEQCDDGNDVAGDGCEPDCTLTPDNGGHGGHGGHGHGWGDASDLLGIESFGDTAGDAPIDPVINTRTGGGVQLGSDRGPSRVPAGDRLPR